MKSFTLVELLACITILGLLAIIAIPASNSALQASRKAKETTAIKSLNISYISYANDNNNTLLKSYDIEGTAYDINGNLIGGDESHEAKRWPWRLAPYFNYDFYKTTHVNEIEKYIKSQGGLSQTYLVSVIPSFGLSIYCGGNDYENNKLKIPIATKINQIAKPSQFITFVSSRSLAIGKRYEGFYYVEHPKSSVYNSKGNPKNSGNISARYNNQAVVSFLGGNVSLIKYEELLNTNLWAP